MTDDPNKLHHLAAATRSYGQRLRVRRRRFFNTALGAAGAIGVGLLHLIPGYVEHVREPMFIDKLLWGLFGLLCLMAVILIGSIGCMIWITWRLRRVDRVLDRYQQVVLAPQSEH